MPSQDDQRTLDWTDSPLYHHMIRTLGIQQFLNTWNQNLSRPEDGFLWGDEVEYVVVRRDDKQGSVHLVPCSHELLQVECTKCNVQVAPRVCGIHAGGHPIDTLYILLRGHGSIGGEHAGETSIAEQAVVG